MKDIALILFFISLSIVGFSQNTNSFYVIDTIPVDADLQGESDYDTINVKERRFDFDVLSEILRKRVYDVREINLDKYVVYIIKNGKEVFNEVFGTDCKISLQKDFYSISFQTKKNTTAYQKIKVVSRKDNEVIVKIVGDLSPQPLSFIVKDSLDAKQKIDFISIDTGNITHGMKFSD